MWWSWIAKIKAKNLKKLYWKKKRKKESLSLYNTLFGHFHKSFTIWICMWQNGVSCHWSHSPTNQSDQNQIQRSLLLRKKLLLLLNLSVFRWTITTETQKQRTTSLGLGHLINSHERSRRFWNWQRPTVGDSVCRLSSYWTNWFLLFFFFFLVKNNFFLFESYFCIVIVVICNHMRLCTKMVNPNLLTRW